MTLRLLPTRPNRASTTRPEQRAQGFVGTLLRNPLGVVALVTSVTVLLLAVFGPIIWGEAAETNDFLALDAPPSPEHVLGTDRLGRDVLARVLVATRLSVGLALAATGLGLLLGILLGAAASMAGGWLGRLLSAGILIGVAFPGLLLALFFAVIFGIGPTGAVLALGVAIAPSFARLTQTLAAAVVSQDYVAAARVLGISRFRILRRHVLPNLAEPLIVNGTMAAGSCLLAFAGLSYLGIGVRSPDYDWGRLLAEGLNAIYSNPALALGPAMAIVVCGLAFNFSGEFAAQLVAGRARVYRTERGGPERGHEVAAVAPAAGTEARDEHTGPDGDPDGPPLLSVRNLRIRIPTAAGTIEPVRGVDLDIRPGEAVGVLGESGSGKSLTALAIAQLTQDDVAVSADRLRFADLDLREPVRGSTRGRLGTSLSLVFQDPMSSLNPIMKVGDQLAEVATEHQGLGRRAARVRAVDRLRAVRIAAAERRARQYPYEWSGGMRQRAMIGLGLMGQPRLLIADEPTTALDVTVQQQVLQLIEATRERTGAALLLISHDISVVSSVCDRILVMYAGKVVEDLPVDQLQHAQHPYTRGLVAAVPTMDTPRDAALATIPGRPPNPADLPVGCPFAPRCPRADDVCQVEPPLVRHAATSAPVACHHPGGDS